MILDYGNVLKFQNENVIMKHWDSYQKMKNI